MRNPNLVGEPSKTNYKGSKDRKVDKCLPPRNRYRTWLIRFILFKKEGVILLVEAGRMLKTTRESSGVSLDEVSSDLGIPVLALEQIEDGSIGSFDDIYALKDMIIEYAKYLGVSIEIVVNKFNEYMFDYTSKIPMAEIEKAVREKEKEKDEEDRIQSPYTKVYPKEKPLPYIIAGIVIIILVILAVIWSIKQITIDNNSTDIIGYFN